MGQSTKALLGGRIKELRKMRGLTQEQLSQQIGIDPKSLSRIEVGGSFPSFEALDKLAKVLKVDLRDFFEFDNKPKNARELRRVISELIKDASEDKLRLAVKVLKALLM
jgi:transcriptional regulator with XRE-family HTH domain